MSFDLRTHAIIITSGSLVDASPTLPNGEQNDGSIPWKKLDEVPNITDEGWDTLSISYAFLVHTLTAETCASYFPPGRQLSGRKFWCISSRPSRAGAGIWTVEVSYKGWAATKPAKIRVGAGADQQSGENVRVPNPPPATGTSLFKKISVLESTPTISITYLKDDITPEDTLAVGCATAPPAWAQPPGVAASGWDALVEFTYHWPNGWVLMGREQDRLPGAPNVGLVTDTYKFIRPITP